MLTPPQHDPAGIFELYRGNYATELLVAAVAHFDVFSLLAQRPARREELRDRLGLADRPLHVLVTALRAMGLLATDAENRLIPSPSAREHLVGDCPFSVSDYLGLTATSPGVLTMVDCLRENRPVGTGTGGQGTAFIYRSGVKSAMEEAELARHFTLALAGRAVNVAPVLADRLHLADSRILLDVGGGTGIYSIALLQKYPRLRAIIVDRPEVLRVATEFAVKYGVADRMECTAADIFADPLPAADAILLSNVLHDWDVAECQNLIQRCTCQLPLGGQLIVHDVFLHDDLGGPLAIALYSAALFLVTEGRAYSAGEYGGWLQTAGLSWQPPVATLAHCGAIVATRGE